VKTVTEVDPEFYDRADAHIHLSNDQTNKSEAGRVSASMMYATARFNAWLTARGFESAEQMDRAREEILDYFCKQYRAMLIEHLDDYATNFSRYMGVR
jgi:hypothetical protein